MKNTRIFNNILVFFLISLFMTNTFALSANDKVSRWGGIAKREAQFIYGPNAPTPLFLGQIKQESSGDEKVTAFDGGMGLTQFMKGTVDQIVHIYPELATTLGPANPYNPTWAIRGQVRFLYWIKKRVKGNTDCDTWGASLDAYNAGLGYVMQAQKKSPEPGVWFGLTEYVPTKQSAKNKEYSREYPRWILFKHQKNFVSFGNVVCDIKNPPIDIPQKF
jgi:soluble lytic murein transglycosylase-like protein